MNINGIQTDSARIPLGIQVESKWNPDGFRVASRAGARTRARSRNPVPTHTTLIVGSTFEVDGGRDVGAIEEGAWA